MNANEMRRVFWSALNSAMLPLARRAYDDLNDQTKRGVEAQGPPDVPPELLAQLGGAVQAAPSGGPPPPLIAAAALGEDYDGVFRAARRRAAWYFALHLVVATGTIVIFLGAGGGAVVSAVGWGVSVWTWVFGGLSVGSAFGWFVTRPLRMLQVALVTITRLDLLQLRHKQRVRDCERHRTLTERMDCRTQAWNALKEELDVLVGK